jgi:tyrosyl-tRNA synthetase
LQKELAKDVTVRVHSEADYNAAVEASEILFKGTVADLAKLSEEMFLEIFEGVPQFIIAKHLLGNELQLVDLLTEHTTIFPSKGEARKMLGAGGVSINKEKIITRPSTYVIEQPINPGDSIKLTSKEINTPFSSYPSVNDIKITTKDLINNKYILIQKGKKNYFLVKVV